MSRAKHITLVEGYRPTVRLKPGVECKLEKHYRGVLRRVVSKLDYLARKNPNRFVYVTVPALTKMCVKFKDGKPTGEAFTQRSVELALAFLRRQGFISALSEQETDGGMRRGFFVIDHANITEPLPRGRGCGITARHRPRQRAMWTPGIGWHEVAPEKVFEPE